jgi:signal transduction histidine kinase
MPNSPPRSFRRLLILRLLLLGIPILLVGQYLTLRKARTGLLETTRQSLSSSAVLKAEFLEQVADLQIDQVRILAQSPWLASDDLGAIQEALAQFTSRSARSLTCVQLLDATASTVLLSTCPSAEGVPVVSLPWITAPQPEHPEFALVHISSPPLGELVEPVANSDSQVSMAWAAPIYAAADQSLKYTVILWTRWSQLESWKVRSRVSYTTVLDQPGTVKIHSAPSLAGRPIQPLEAPQRLPSMLDDARAGGPETYYLESYLPDYPEWLVGFSGMELEVAPGQLQQWIVLAVTPLEQALQGLADIRNVLVAFTLGLLTAQILLVLWLARRLSRPVEQLCHYAREIQDLSHLKEVPQNFQVWELNHLAQVLNGMIKRLEHRAHELRHAWQDAQLANQLKSEFLANTSHELRTPLNAIIGCIRLVRDDCCDDEAEEKEFLATADQAAVHLLGIINDILDIAKIEAGTLEIEMTLVDVRQIIAEVVNLQTLQIQQKGLVLQWVSPEQPLWVRGDVAKLKQVLLNLVYNATKFTTVGQITITADVEREEHSNGGIDWPPGVNLPTPLPRIVVSVSDTGVGIAPSQQAKLFQPFVMADGTTTRQHEGTGLGLAISRNFMTLMGGSITLYSAGIGRGTQVLFALPLREPEVATAPPLATSGMSAPKTPSCHPLAPEEREELIETHLSTPQPTHLD